MENKDLKAKYDEMHKQGASAWYGDGREERETILKMGEPWENKNCFEIGCGEGDLGIMLRDKYPDIFYWGIDYSETAIQKARHKCHTIGKMHYAADFWHGTYKDKFQWSTKYDRLIMQGVLEHLDDPFTELKWMMDNLLVEHGDVITSSPCFLNPRGIVWMTLDMLGAVMSKTDLHFLHPWHFEKFCVEHGYRLAWRDCDTDWGNGKCMIEDLKQRIPLALKDGNLPQGEVGKLTDFLYEMIHQFVVNGDKSVNMTPLGPGATMVYRITK